MWDRVANEWRLQEVIDFLRNVDPEALLHVQNHLGMSITEEQVRGNLDFVSFWPRQKLMAAPLFER